MAATGTTPSELLIDINNIIRSKNKPNTITPDTHSDLLDNLVKILSANTYVNQGVFIESASTITFTNTSGGTFDVTGITSENTYLTGGTFDNGTIILGDNSGNNISISGISVNVSPTTLIVSNNGDNTTAEKGSLLKQYSTLVYAANQSVSGDTIYVMAGNYSLTDDDWSTYGGQSGTTLYRDGVTWYFEPGSKVTNNIDRNNEACIFYSTGSNQSCSILGEGSFYNSDGSVVGRDPRIIAGFDDNGPGSDIHFECKDVDYDWCNVAFNLNVFKNVDINISGTIYGKHGSCMAVQPNDTVEGDTFNIFVNEMSLFSDVSNNGRIFNPFYTSGNGGASSGITCNFEFNTINAYSRFTTVFPPIISSIDDSVVNIRGKYYKDHNPNGVSDALSSLIGVRYSHNSKVNIHIDNAIATSVLKSMIMLHNNDSAEQTEKNYVTISGRYECLNGRTITSEEGGAVYNTDTYILDGEFISNTNNVLLLSDANTDIELRGELRCQWDDPSGHAILVTNPSHNIRLRDLEIVCANSSALAISSSSPTDFNAYNVFSQTNDISNNVTFIHPNGFYFPKEPNNDTLVVTATTTQDIDWSISDNFEYTISGNTTFSFVNDVDGKNITTAIKQDGTGGHTVTWPAGVKWGAGGTEPTMTNTSGSTDVYTLIKINGTIYGSYIQDFQ